MKYRVKYEVMKPQLNARGNYKKDRNGDPLCSIRIKQKDTQKYQMAEVMERQSKMYDACPELWGTDPHRIGNDPVSYTPAEIFADLNSRFKNWRSPGNDIYKSFVERHNAMMDVYIQTIWQNQMTDMIQDIELFETLRIELVEIIPMRQRMLDILKDSDLFE